MLQSAEEYFVLRYNISALTITWAPQFPESGSSLS